MMLRRLCVVVFAVLAPLASVLASPAAAQEEWPQYSRDDAAGCDVTTSEDGAEERSCDDGSYGARWADGSGYWYDAASGCQIDIDPAGAIVPGGLQPLLIVQLEQLRIPHLPIQGEALSGEGHINGAPTTIQSTNKG